MKTIEKLKEIYQGTKVNIYQYGSVCYGTNDEKSDEDFIIICDDHPEVSLPNVEIHQYSFKHFISSLDSHEIWALECFYLGEEMKHEGFTPAFCLNLAKLRRECSSKASNSWVKAKKKIEKEGEIYIGEKSLFHALRILDFANQIAEHIKIVNYSSQNENYKKIVGQNKSWLILKGEFQPLYNSLGSRLRLLCPLD